MAEGEDNQQGGEGLKYLGFVQDAAAYAVTTFSNVYLYAKDKSGPLQPGVDIIEGPVKNVAVPLYNRFSYSQWSSQVCRQHDRSLPPIVKDASNQVVSVDRAAPEAARSLASPLPEQTKIPSKVLYGDN
ncbi:hypothetical protein GH714_003351 [Hevea brasiliensis]|uniref:Rubber elongation factor protein n=1 Tax=Hevea brasiliensis TaxID=3981 RepID=A0A6A6LYK8_HEVBR|nr:hypothetical protein GH714_003351 [Hevea brasiliensis]